jgi:ABC-type lipoprotein release transport system permease subunit
VGLLAFLPGRVVAAAVVAALAVLLAITAAAGFYPSRLASRVPPAVALRHE